MVIIGKKYVPLVLLIFVQLSAYAMLFYEPDKKVTAKTAPLQIQKTVLGMHMICRAQEALSKGQLKKFDGSIGDIACHVLTAAVTDLASDIAFTTTLASLTPSLKTALTKIEKESLIIPFNKKGIPLSSIQSEALSSVLPVSRPINFLAAAYFLTAYSKVGVLSATPVSEYDETPLLQKEFPAFTSKKGIGELFKKARKIINDEENMYIEKLSALSSESPTISYLSRYASLSKQAPTQWTPEFHKIMPDFATFKLITAQKKSIPYVISLDMICTHHDTPSTHHVLLAYQRNSKKYESTPLTSLDDDHPCHVTEGLCYVPHTDAQTSIFCKHEDYDATETFLYSLPKGSVATCPVAQKHLDTVRTMNVKTWILAGGADHPQGYDTSINTSNWKDIDKKRFAKELATYKEKAKTICSPFTGIFPRHDTPSTVGELLKKEKMYA